MHILKRKIEGGKRWYCSSSRYYDVRRHVQDENLSGNTLSRIIIMEGAYEYI